MFLKVMTGISLISTSFTGAAIATSNEGDNLYPIKAQVQETLTNTVQTEAKVDSRVQARSNNSDNGLNVFGNLGISVK